MDVDISTIVAVIVSRRRSHQNGCVSGGGLSYAVVMAARRMGQFELGRTVFSDTEDQGRSGRQHRCIRYGNKKTQQSGRNSVFHLQFKKVWIGKLFAVQHDPMSVSSDLPGDIQCETRWSSHFSVLRTAPFSWRETHDKS